MITDSVGDTLIRIKNGYRAKKKEVVVPVTKISRELLKILKDKKFVEDFTEDENKKRFSVYLYDDQKQHFQDLKQISKPGRRIYINTANIPHVRNGYGICIISTSQGMMTGKEAKEKNAGGELLAKLW